MEGSLKQQGPREEEGADALTVLSPKRKTGRTIRDSFPNESVNQTEFGSFDDLGEKSPTTTSHQAAISAVPLKSVVIERSSDDSAQWGDNDDTESSNPKELGRASYHNLHEVPKKPPPRNRQVSPRPTTKDMSGVTQRLRERFSGGGSRRNLLSRSASRSSLTPGTPTNDVKDVVSSPTSPKRLSMTDSFSGDSEYSFAQSFHDSLPASSHHRSPATARRNRKGFTIQRDQLIDSLGWFSRHTPLSVLEDLSIHELSLWRESNGELINKPSALERENSASDEEDDDGSSSLSSLSHVDDCSDSSYEGTGFEVDNPLGPGRTMRLPHSVKRESAILFVDITGFTKLSTLLDVETLSKVINTYFDHIVQEVAKYDGDIIKFAGDAFFAEWRVVDNVDTSNSVETDRENEGHPLDSLTRSLHRSRGESIGRRSVSDCVIAAALCASAIVKEYSDYQVPILRDAPVVYGGENEDRRDSMLNVHCGIGVGTVVGLHVGDYREGEGHMVELRREYLIMGNPIDQVSLAADAALDGQVLASPEAVSILNDSFRLTAEILSASEPVCIASRARSFLMESDQAEILTPIGVVPGTRFLLHDTLHKHCANVDRSALARLHTQLALYVHPVVRGDELSVSTSHHGTVASRNASQSRQIAEAELRSVYTLFVKAMMSPKLSGDDETDAKLFTTLGNVMHVVCRELDRFSGHLRQFIIDDKGVVLIGTFGLRGSTFPNMVANSALPATFAIHEALKTELNIDNRIGATFGKVYCGVIGGVRRHEFAVMGAPVNLAARLMYSPKNNGILVDEAVQAQADARFAFRKLPPVQAKGYDKPVTIVEPLHAVSMNKKRGGPPSFVGRKAEVAELLQAANRILDESSCSETFMAFVVGESGMGKTLVGYKASEEIKKLCGVRQKKMFCSRSSSTETEQRIPLSSFRKILLAAIKDFCIYEGTIAPSGEEKRRGSMGRQKSQRSVRGPGLMGRQLSSKVSQRGLTPAGMLSRQMSQRSQLSPRPQRLQRTLSLKGSGSQFSQRALLPPRGLSRRRLSGRKLSQSSGFASEASNSNRSVIVPYFEKLCWVCEELDYPYEYADIVGAQLLRIEGASPTVTQVDGHIPTVDEVVDFLTLAYLKITQFSDLSLVFFDDFQWIDALTWKIIRSLCQKSDNLLLICAMRSHDKQAFRRMSDVQAWHEKMESRIIEISLGPLELSEVKELIGMVLGYEESCIDETLSTDVYNRTGGLPIYATQLLESIKRSDSVSLDELGMLQWTDAAKNEKFRIGANSVAVIEESFLNRFDSLGRSVREVLQTCAVLGESFSYYDVIRVHPELTEHEIEEALEAAVDELIILEDIFDDDDDDLSLLSDLGLSAGGDSRGAIHGMRDRSFQFSHAMWRTSVLNKMLKERRVELHRLIAQSMEKEKVQVTESSDIARVLILFDHWKACGEFTKAAPLSLAVGLRLEEWDLLDQSLNLYQDSLDMCYENATVVQGKQDSPTNSEGESWVLASASPVALDLILRLHVRIGRCLFLLGRQGESEDSFRDAFTIITTSEEAAKKNQGIMLPIVSGLCSICYERMIYEEDFLKRLESYLKHYIAEATRDGNPVHICRAISMEASFFARLGQFERALSSVETLKSHYDVHCVSSGISDEYGRDYAVQCLADSVQWYCVVGDVASAEEQISYVIEEIFPHLEEEDLDVRLEMLFPVLMVMKEIGKSAKAEKVLKEYVISPYRDPYDKLSSRVPAWLPLFNPLAYLLEIAKMEDSERYDDDLLDEMEEWVLKGDIGFFPFDLRRKGNLVVGEICWRLSKRDGIGTRGALVEKCRSLLYYIVFDDDNDDQSDQFMVDSARAMFESGGNGSSS